MPPQPGSSLAVPEQGHRSLPRPASCHLLAALGRRDSQLPNPHPPLLTKQLSEPEGVGHHPSAAKKRLSVVCSSHCQVARKALLGLRDLPAISKIRPTQVRGRAPRDKEQAGTWPNLCQTITSPGCLGQVCRVPYRHLTLVQDLLRIPSQASHCKAEGVSPFPRTGNRLARRCQGALGIVCLPVWKPSKMIIVQSLEPNHWV